MGKIGAVKGNDDGVDHENPSGEMRDRFPMLARRCLRSAIAPVSERSVAEQEDGVKAAGRCGTEFGPAAFRFHQLLHNRQSEASAA